MAKQETTTMSGWTGWIAFAAVMMIMLGFFHMMAGAVALFQEDVYTVTENAVWVFDYSQWGWIHIIGGLLAFLAAGSVMKGHLYGRIFTVFVAMGSMLANMAFIPIYPLWSLLMVTVCVLVLWAVVVHGDEVWEE